MKITIDVNVGSTNWRQSYLVVETRAPQAYDYYGTIQVEDGGNTRIVAIPQDDVEIQGARYWSGTYGSLPVEGVDENVLLDLIIARLINRG